MLYSQMRCILFLTSLFIEPVVGPKRANRNSHECQSAPRARSTEALGALQIR